MMGDVRSATKVVVTVVVLLLMQFNVIGSQQDLSGNSQVSDNDDAVHVIPSDDNVQITGLYHADNDDAQSDPPSDRRSAEGHSSRGHLEKLGNQGELIFDEIPVIEYEIGGQDFYEYFLRKRKPVLFRGITSDWMATKQWKNESYLLEKYPEVLFDVEMGKVYEYSQHPRQTMTMREFLSRYKVETKMYLDSPFPQSPMTYDMGVPLMMQCEKLYTRFSSAHMLFSNGNSSSPLHYDGYENFLTVMSGYKEAYLADPKYGPEIYINDYHDFPGLSPVNPEKVDLLKYPKVSEARFHKATINPGDMLYIPQGWFHQVRSFDSPNIAVSMWFHYYSSEESLGDKSTDILAKLQTEVNKSPETIECGNQVVSMALFKNTELSNIGDQSAPSDSTKEVVNQTVLYDPVSPSDDMMYIGSDDTFIYAIDTNTGKVKWKVKTREDTGSTCAFSPDTVFVYCGADDAYMRAMHVKTGLVEWMFRTGDRVISSAVVNKQGVIFFGSLDQHMYALFPNGTLKWKIALNGTIWSSSALHSSLDIVYIATDDKLYNYNVFALEQETGNIVWKRFSTFGFKSSPKLNAEVNEVYLCDNGGNVYIFDASSGDVKNRIRIGEEDEIMSSPTYRNGLLFIPTMSGILIAYNTLMGETKWQIEIGKGKSGTNSSPLIGPNDHLFIGSGNGTVYALDQGTGNVIWRTDIGTGIFFSSPRIGANGLLFIGTVDGPIYALDSTIGEITWSVKTNGPVPGTPLLSRSLS